MLFMACLKGFEPLTFWFVAKHSIRLSYRHISAALLDSVIDYSGFLPKSQAFFENFQKNIDKPASLRYTDPKICDKGC